MTGQRSPFLRSSFATAATVLAGAMLCTAAPTWADPRVVEQVIVPDEDRFTPFSIIINQGDIVEWVNTDTDDHTVVADKAFTTAGHQTVDHLIVGTENNNGQPGRFKLLFRNPGVFVYYCRFHARLDDENQPVAPGPDGGIEDPPGNFGTPMMGVITVRPNDR